MIGACIIRKRLEGISYQSPPTASLPDFRVNEERPFKYTGIDYCGPVFIKTAIHTERNYIVCMTCAATRMIHSASLLVQYLKRFVRGRGLPKLMLSDNGKTFKADQLKVFNTRNGIILRFNLAKDHWWGGLFERLIRSTKRCLRNCARNCTLTHEEFYLVLAEIEGALNSRPLTYLDEDNIEEPLIPIYLHCGHRILNPFEGEGYESEPDLHNNSEEAISRKHQLEQVLQSFWKRWRKDYLLELRLTHVRT